MEFFSTRILYRMELTIMEEILERYIQATNSHSFPNVKKLLHQQAIYWFTDQTCTTMEEIQSYFEKAWRTVEDEKYWAEDVRWVSVENKSATCLYTYHYEGYVKGNFVSGSGRATNVFVKENEKWLLIHEHLSSFNN